MIKSSLLLMLITIFSKALGFFRDILLSYFYGASGISDAYLISQTIPDTFFMTIGAAIFSSFIPLYTELRQKEKLGDSEKFTNNLVNILILMSSLILFLGIVFAPQIVNVFASGFYGETLNLTIVLTRISFIGLIFTTLTALFSSYLQANNEFVVSGSIGIPLNIVNLIFIIISAYTGSLALGVGSIVAHVVQLVYLMPTLAKTGYKYKMIVDFKDPYIIKMLRMSVPVILGVSVNEFNNIIDRTIASNITLGAVSALSYAGRVNNLIETVFIMTILTLIYPSLSRLAIRKDSSFNELLFNTISLVNYLTIPSSVILIIFSKEIISLLFGRGGFTAEATSLTSEALIYYSIGLFFIGLQQVLVRGFYSMQDTKTPAFNSVVGLIINVILSIYLSRYMGLGGVALATSISTMIISLLLILSLRKRIKNFNFKKLLKSFLKIIGASSIMGVTMYIVNNILNGYLPEFFSLIFALLIGLIIYILITYMLKIKEITKILELIIKEFVNKK